MNTAGNGQGIQPDSSGSRVDARADLAEAELLPGLDERRLDVFAVLPRPEELQPGNAGHAVVQRPHVGPAIVNPPMLKNLISGSSPPFAFSSTSSAVGPWTW